MLSVRWPTIFMAVDRGTPARSRFRTAVRRKSWGRRSGIPAFLQAVTQARRKDLMGFPARWNIHEMIAPVACSPTSVRARWRSKAARRSGVSGNWRPSSFLVSPGSRRSQPLRKSTWDQVPGQDLRLHAPAGDIRDLDHGREVIGKVGEHGVKFFSLKEAGPGIALLQHVDVRPTDDPPRFLTKPEHPLERRQLS